MTGQKKSALPYLDCKGTKLFATAFDNRLAIKSVIHLASSFIACHNPCPLEDIEVMRNRWLCYIESFTDIRNAELFFHQKLEYFKAGLVTHREKNLTAFLTHNKSY